jgi:hypothetical protein
VLGIVKNATSVLSISEAELLIQLLAKVFSHVYEVEEELTSSAEETKLPPATAGASKPGPRSRKTAAA